MVTARAACSTSTAPATSAAKTDTQSSERQAGTTPAVLSSPRVGLRPTIPLSAAGTRPEPAVSVPRAKLTWPAATATAEPELEPPEIEAAAEDALATAVRRAGAGQAGGELVEVRLADEQRAGVEQPAHHRSVLRPARYPKSGQPAVVAMPATSMLSLTANGMPYSGSAGSP